MKYLLIEEDPGASDSTKVDPIGVTFTSSRVFAVYFVWFICCVSVDLVTLNWLAVDIGFANLSPILLLLLFIA